MKVINPQDLGRIMVKLSVLLGFTVFGALSGVAQDDSTLNKVPFTELGNYVRQQIKSNALDLNAPFDIELTGALPRSGKLEPDSLKFIRAEGDKGMAQLARRAVEAANDSGLIQNLQSLGGREVRILAQQDDSFFAGAIKFEVESETRAVTLATLFSQFVDFKRRELKAKDDPSGAFANDLILLESMKIGPAAKVVTIDIRMARRTFRDMIERALAK